MLKEKGKEKAAAEVKTWLESKIAGHKKCRGGVYVVEAVPKSAAGKILRRQLKVEWEGVVRAECRGGGEGESEAVMERGRESASERGVDGVVREEEEGLKSRLSSEIVTNINGMYRTRFYCIFTGYHIQHMLQPTLSSGFLETHLEASFTVPKGSVGRSSWKTSV